MMPLYRKLWVWLTLLGAAARVVLARPPNEPDPIETFQMHLREVYIQTDADMFWEELHATSPVQNTTRDRVIIQPAVGLGLDGSFYHPNLLYYRLATELGVDWQSSRIDSKSGDNSSFLQRYHVSLNLLRAKPYAFSVFADKDLTYRDYDFFNRVRVDSTRYGANAGYNTGPVPFSVAYTRYEEQVSESARPTKTTEDMLNFSASNSRRGERANTQLLYNLNQYSHQDGDLSLEQGLSQNVSLTDSEYWGRKDRIQLLSMLNYNSQSQVAQPNQKVFGHETLRLEHTPRLRSIYEYGQDYSTAGDSEASTINARAGLSYQLYKNLTSSVDVHWQESKAQSPGSSLDVQRYGVSLGEQYTRHLGSWANLLLGYSGSFDREERNSSGAELKVVNEAHTLIDSVVTLLNQPDVNTATIQVTDAAGMVTYHQNTDYRLLAHGAFTEIQRVTSFGSAITNGTPVLVTYTAGQQPSAAYDTINNGFNFRLDFFDGRLGVFGRWTKLDYHGGNNLVLDAMDNKLIGVDAMWRWFRVGTEYEVADSKYAPYDRARAFQSATFQPALDATLTFDCDESWIKHRDSGVNQSIYSFITRYQQQLWQSLSWRVEGGIMIERGGGYNRDVGTARVGFDWEIGKIMFKIGYELNSEEYSTDSRTRHYLFIRARRNFL